MRHRKTIRLIRPVMHMRMAIIFLFLVSLAGQGLAQATPAAFGKDLELYQSRRLQEKLFVHTDKEFYLAGEICWFKLYDVDATFHQPLDLSKIAYLEWLDKDNKPVMQTKIGLSKGHGDGSLYLPLTLHSGNYKLRAYTAWMKNYGADWFFEKTITVVNSRRSAEDSAIAASPQYTVAFFPEGGNLVENISSKIAFRITDQYGRSITCTGVVTEDDEDTVVRFQPYRFGIGSFMLTPRTGHRYRATIRLADGTAVSHLLPTAYKEGMVMRVEGEEGNHIRVNVESAGSGSQPGAPGSQIYLIAHTRQSVKLAETAALRDGKASFLVDKTILGDGISTLTVFNEAKQPVCERLVFKSPAHDLHLTVDADGSNYTTRKKINLQVGSIGKDGRPVAADCSLSVFRVDSMQTAPTDHIDSYLWLISDLKGKIESPGYYFDHPGDEQAMDNLMISHGWRRFRWEDVLHQSAPSFEFPPEYNGAIISGRIIDTRTGKPAKEVQAYLSVPGTRTQFSSAFCDKEGDVRFELKDFYGGQEIIAQTNPADSMFRVDIANPFSETYTDRPLLPFEFPRRYADFLTDKSIAMQVLNRYGGGKLKQFHFPDVDTGTFYHRPDYSYVLDDFTRFTTMEEVMREYVILMLVKNNHGHFHLPLFNIAANEFFESDPLILLDGVPVFDIDKLIALDPLKVRKLDMIHRKYFLGATSYEGIMNWTTYKGDLGGYILDPHAAVIDYEGLQLKREFYSPSYATEEASATHLPDFRNVLYWSPVVSTDSLGKHALSFYTSDIPGKYVIVVEGLSADGATGSGMMSFEVK